MSIIKVEGLTFSYPSSGENIFENVGFQIDSDWKLGCVGRNGRGKTTLLKLLAGEYEYRGRIISSVPFDYFPYAVRDGSRTTEEVLAEVAAFVPRWRLERELNCLEADIGCLYRPFDTLSEGERTKALLAAMFSNEGRFLLIDEPTNHLDARAREVLSAYLRKQKSFILVSHDRRFVDGCVDHILSINRSSIEVCGGNFSSYFADFAARQELERKQNDRLKADIRRLRDSARRTAGWADAVEASKIGAGDKGYVGHKAAKMMKRAKVTEARMQNEIEQKQRLFKNAEREEELTFSPLAYRAEKLAAFSTVAPAYDGRAVCSPVTFDIERGDRIAIDGKNGSGKSSLIKLLCGEATEHTGEVKTGSQLVVSYVPQSAAALRGTVAELARRHALDETLFKAVLYRMGFDGGQFEKDTAEFSDGQKKKVLLAKSLCERAHLYVWDEPLNYIDVYTRMQIEDLILRCKPTLVFVEHDGAFRDNISTKRIVLSPPA